MTCEKAVLDANVRARKGALMRPSGSTFTLPTMPHALRKRNLQICRTNQRAKRQDSSESGTVTRH